MLLTRSAKDIDIAFHSLWLNWILPSLEGLFHLRGVVMQVKWTDPLLSGCSHVWIKRLITLQIQCQLCKLIVMVFRVDNTHMSMHEPVYQMQPDTPVSEVCCPCFILRSSELDYHILSLFWMKIFFKYHFCCQRINYCSLLILSVGAEAVDKKLVREKSSRKQSSSELQHLRTG